MKGEIRPAVLRVLHIEDEPSDAGLFLIQLKRSGITQLQVTQVSSLCSAMQRISEQTFDVALLDLGLPDETGLANILTLQSGAPLLPIVVYTGLDDLAVARESILAGASDYAVKGRTSIRDLVRQLYTAVDRHELKRGLYGQLADLAYENRQLTEMADQDPLTRLYNRRGLEKRLQCRAELRGPSSYATLINIVDFKGINARQGSRTGDQVLLELACCLVASSHEQTLLARLSNDDFVAVGHGGLTEAKAQSQALTAALRLGTRALPAAQRHLWEFKLATTLIGRHGGVLSQILDSARAAPDESRSTTDGDRA